MTPHPEKPLPEYPEDFDEGFCPDWQKAVAYWESRCRLAVEALSRYPDVHAATLQAILPLGGES